MDQKANRYLTKDIQKANKHGKVHIICYSVQLSSVQSCPTLCNPMNHSMPGIPVHHQLPESTQTHAHWVGDATQPSHPLLSPSPPAPNPSQHQGLSNESTLHMRRPKYWSFSFSISPSNEHPRLISFRMDWLDILALQGTLKSLLQHHSSKASIFQRSAFFTVQLSHPYMTTGKTIALTRQTFIGKIMSLLFNMLSIKESQIQPTVKDYNTSIGLPRWCPGRGHGNPLQYTCLENPMDRGTWQAAVHRVAQSRTWLNRLSTHAHIH